MAVAEAGAEGEGSEDPILGEDAEAVPTPVEEEVVEPSGDGYATIFRPALWRALEIVLGLVTLGLALATIRAWRTRQR